MHYVRLYDSLNRCVFTFLLKASRVLPLVTSLGKLFQILGPTDLKDPLCTWAIFDLKMGGLLNVDVLR